MDVWLQHRADVWVMKMWVRHQVSRISMFRASALIYLFFMAVDHLAFHQPAGGLERVGFIGVICLWLSLIYIEEVGDASRSIHVKCVAAINRRLSKVMVFLRHFFLFTFAAEVIATPFVMMAGETLVHMIITHAENVSVIVAFYLFSAFPNLTPPKDKEEQEVPKVILEPSP